MAMRTMWEYARLQLSCDPGKDVNEIYGFLSPPGASDWEQLGLVTDITALLNKLGRDGWELVGMPSDVNAVFTYQAANSTWHDRASFVERHFLFKRPVHA